MTILYCRLDKNVAILSNYEVHTFNYHISDKYNVELVGVCNTRCNIDLVGV